MSHFGRQSQEDSIALESYKRLRKNSFDKLSASRSSKVQIPFSPDRSSGHYDRAGIPANRLFSVKDDDAEGSIFSNSLSATSNIDPEENASNILSLSNLDIPSLRGLLRSSLHEKVEIQKQMKRIHDLYSTTHEKYRESSTLCERLASSLVRFRKSRLPLVLLSSIRIKILKLKYNSFTKWCSLRDTNTGKTKKSPLLYTIIYYTSKISNLKKIKSFQKWKQLTYFQFLTSPSSSSSIRNHQYITDKLNFILMKRYFRHFKVEMQNQLKFNTNARYMYRMIKKIVIRKRFRMWRAASSMQQRLQVVLGRITSIFRLYSFSVLQNYWNRWHSAVMLLCRNSLLVRSRSSFQLRKKSILYWKIYYYRRLDSRRVMFSFIVRQGRLWESMALKKWQQIAFQMKRNDRHWLGLRVLLRVSLPNRRFHPLVMKEYFLKWKSNALFIGNLSLREQVVNTSLRLAVTQKTHTCSKGFERIRNIFLRRSLTTVSGAFIAWKLYATHATALFRYVQDSRRIVLGKLLARKGLRALAVSFRVWVAAVVRLRLQDKLSLACEKLVSSRTLFRVFSKWYRASTSSIIVRSKTTLRKVILSRAMKLSYDAMISSGFRRWKVVAITISRMQLGLKQLVWNMRHYSQRSYFQTWKNVSYHYKNEEYEMLNMKFNEQLWIVKNAAVRRHCVDVLTVYFASWKNYVSEHKSRIRIMCRIIRMFGSKTLSAAFSTWYGNAVGSRKGKLLLAIALRSYIHRFTTRMKLLFYRWKCAVLTIIQNSSMGQENRALLAQRQALESSNLRLREKTIVMGCLILRRLILRTTFQYWRMCDKRLRQLQRVISGWLRASASMIMRSYLQRWNTTARRMVETMKHVHRLWVQIKQRQLRSGFMLLKGKTTWVWTMEKVKKFLFAALRFDICDYQYHMIPYVRCMISLDALHPFLSLSICSCSCFFFIVQ